MSKSTDGVEDMGRRALLRGGAVAGVSAAVAPLIAPASAAPAKPAPAPVPRPDVRAESLPPQEVESDPAGQSDCGANFMVDVLKTLDLKYIAINPASSFRGLHESIINHGGNSPELLTCVHEEIAVAMAHGYAKIAGKPMGVMAHGTVGLQHASMALYNAYCDRVPVYMLIGNILAAEKRGLTAEWQHSAQDPAAIVRDFLKWDDQPASLRHFAESALRAYTIATTPPAAPVLLSIDTELQENPMPAGDFGIPKLPRQSFPVADQAALLEVAKWLVEAEAPLLVVDRLARSQQGMDLLVELAELLQCAVLDQNGRTNFPTLHPLNQSGRGKNVVAGADVVIGLELSDFWATLNIYNDRVHRSATPLLAPGTKTATLGARDLLMTRSNYQEFGRYQEVDLAIAADAQASLPLLIECVKTLATPARREAWKKRGEDLARSSATAREASVRNATIGWDAEPITSARLLAELYSQIKDDDWSLVGQGLHTPWQRRLWDADKTYRFNGYSGGWGIGYNLPASLGAALANREHGRLSVALQGDGDFLYGPGTLWTAAHHRIPILYVMHNNRAYHQELMYVQNMANRLGRGIRNTHIGNVITNPDIDYAMLAKGFGVYAEGPITKPDQIAPALKRALAVVREGHPALVDVVTEPR